jgi:putative oxidoreductase
MKITALVARLLLGLMFTVFGLNGFLHFIPQPPPSGLAAQFFGALYVSHYLSAIFLTQLVGGVLLLLNRFVPLALALLAPVLVNIALFHLCMAPHDFGPAVLGFVLWVVLFIRERSAFAPLFVARKAA